MTFLNSSNSSSSSQVSRTFGDVEAKLPKYGGIPGVVSAEPEIKTFKLTKEDDFIVLACMISLQIFSDSTP